MIVQSECAEIVRANAWGQAQLQLFNRALMVLFCVSLGGMSVALWAVRGVANVYSFVAVLVLLAQAGAAFTRRSRVQVRASVFTLASIAGVALALPVYGAGLPVLLVSVVTTVGSVVLLARQLDQAFANPEWFTERATDTLQNVAPLSEQPVTHSDRALSIAAGRVTELQTIGLLAATLAHDFKNLLSVILTNTSTLKAQLPPEIEEVGEIEQAAHEAVDLCKHVLRMGRDPHRRLEDSSLNRLVEGQLPLLRRLASPRVRVTWEPGPELWFRASPTEFRQLLLNLCVNARDAMPEGGVLKLSTIASNRATSVGSKPTAFAGLVVSDTGVGMDATTQANMFQPFFTTKPSAQGTGLGMAAITAAVEQHNAQIEVHSQLAKGTTISVFFPETAAVEEAPETAPRKSMTRALAGKETVLVVEDDPRLLRAISRTLRHRGYRVLGATDGREALAALGLTRVDLLICDLIMPGMDGLTLLAEVAKVQPTLPILICSGALEDVNPWPEPSNDNRARLSKPFSEESLLLSVRQLLVQPEHALRDERAICTR